MSRGLSLHPTERAGPAVTDYVLIRLVANYLNARGARVAENT